MLARMSPRVRTQWCDCPVVGRDSVREAVRHQLLQERALYLKRTSAGILELVGMLVRIDFL
jgi:hypothetical protein